jgi:archaellum biogenesis protein FlaJ (TadC family)
MKKALSIVVALLAIIMCSGVGLGTHSPSTPVRQGASPITITAVSPLPGTNVTNTTPTIEATFSDSAGTIVVDSVTIVIDGTDVTSLEQTHVTTTEVIYYTPSILQLVNGNHTVVVTVSDTLGNQAQLSWGFTVNTYLYIAPPTSSISMMTVIQDIVLGTVVFAVGFVGFILYLKKTRKFTFKKYFLTHPGARDDLVLYPPLVVAFLFVLVGLFVVTAASGVPPDALDYVLVGGVFIGATPYALASRSELNRVRAYERAFAQFLFEIADAMRGGIDPAKAMLELAETNQGPIRKHLRVAADNIRLGRPFDKVLVEMVQPMKSSLITRYATLVADSSSIGGETAAVIYRAAKDMDDFVKIEVERSKQLTLPVGVIYIAYGVLMAILFALLWIAPMLGSINMNVFNSGGTLPTSSSGVQSVSALNPSVLRERFFQLMLISSVGNGVLIGAFTEGKPKYGLVHSLAMVLGTLIAFAIIFP